MATKQEHYVIRIPALYKDGLEVLAGRKEQLVGVSISHQDVGRGAIKNLLIEEGILDPKAERIVDEGVAA